MNVVSDYQHVGKGGANMITNTGIHFETDWVPVNIPIPQIKRDFDHMGSTRDRMNLYRSKLTPTWVVVTNELRPRVVNVKRV